MHEIKFIINKMNEAYEYCYNVSTYIVMIIMVGGLLWLMFSLWQGQS